MIHAHGVKSVSMQVPISRSSAQTSETYVDTKGYSYCTIEVHTDSAAAATSKLHTTGLTLAEGDTTSSFATISGCVAGTDYTVPTPSTVVGNIYRLGVDLKGRKRYLQITVSPLGAAILMSSHAHLSRAAEMPASTTEQGTVLTHNI